jgi:UDPglucose 6-dehydrogenase
MRLTIVGTGYVGLVTGTCFANTGNEVTCLDLDPAKIARLRAGESPIYEPGLEDLIERGLRSGRLHFTTDKAEAYEGAEAIFLCVGTPSDAEGRADLRYVFAAARDVAEALEARPPARSGELPPIVVTKSTVPVGTNAKVKQLIRSITDRPFAMASNPEFLKEGAAVHDFFKPDRVILGVDDKDVGVALREIYEPYVRQGNPIFLMDIPSAEMVKYASNAMLATKISFINEIANLCEAFGAEIDEVRRGMCSDRRIGNQFLYPGLGYGGSCFPKDVLACVSMGADSGTPTALLRAVHEVNQAQRDTFIQKINQHFAGEVAGRRIAVWGLSFKPRTDDVREAPSLNIVRWLVSQGADVVAYDPVAVDTFRAEVGDVVHYTETDFDALDGADALVICTEWSEFRHPQFDEMAARMKGRVIFDGRNCYRPEVVAEHGFTYYSIGRRPVHA